MATVQRLLATGCAAVLALAACAGPSVEQGGEAAYTPPAPPPVGAPPPPPGWALPDGTWVFTQQYGWIWMTTGEQYVYVPPDGVGEPLEFVYFGPAGWTWVAAPWVWGHGPRPYWGRARPDRFAWYRRGDWRSPQRWRYTGPPPGPGAARAGVRPAPPAPPRVSRGAPPPVPARPPEPSRERGAVAPPREAPPEGAAPQRVQGRAATPRVERGRDRERR